MFIFSLEYRTRIVEVAKEKQRSIDQTHQVYLY